jgi:hypothetical protein
VPYAALHRQGVVHAPFKVAVRGGNDAIFSW